MIKRNKINHERYYVYMLSVDSELFYYGHTSNMEVRKKEHIRHIQKLMDHKMYKLAPSVTKSLKVHHKIASKLARSKRMNRGTWRVCFDICYITDSLIDAKEVELYLIKKSIANKLCCNTKTSY